MAGALDSRHERRAAKIAGVEIKKGKYRIFTTPIEA
jgi:hypothetical protein